MPLEHGNALLSDIFSFYLYALFRKVRTPLVSEPATPLCNMLQTLERDGENILAPFCQMDTLFTSIIQVQVQSHYSLYCFWTRLRWLKITQVLFLFGKLLEHWYEPSNKSQITGFHMEKKVANLLGVSASFWSSHFCNRPFGGRSVEKLLFVSVIVEAFNSPAPTLESSLLSPPLLLSLVVGDSLSNSCWADGCWFSSISPFATFSKSINDFTISFGEFSLFMIPFTRGMHWTPGAFSVSTN